MKSRGLLKTLAAAASVALALILTGCAPPDFVPNSKRVQVVASTNAWGSLVEEIGGPWVQVTSIIDNSNQDPHSHEASVKEQLLVSKADFVIYNGGGYDTFFEQLIAKSKLESSQIIAAGAAAGTDYALVNDPHSWYDTWAARNAAAAILNKIKDGLAKRGTPDIALEQVIENAKYVDRQLDALDEQVQLIHEQDYKFLALETLGYSMLGGDSKSATPVELLRAAANEVDFSPALMLEVRRLLESGEVTILLANKQVVSSQTDQILKWAQSNNVQVLEYSELKPSDLSDYTLWMSYNVRNLQEALLAAKGSGV